MHYQCDVNQYSFYWRGSSQAEQCLCCWISVTLACYPWQFLPLAFRSDWFVLVVNSYFHFQIAWPWNDFFEPPALPAFWSCWYMLPNSPNRSLIKSTSAVIQIWWLSEMNFKIESQDPNKQICMRIWFYNNAGDSFRVNKCGNVFSVRCFSVFPFQKLMVDESVVLLHSHYNQVIMCSVILASFKVIRAPS